MNYLHQFTSLLILVFAFGLMTACGNSENGEQPAADQQEPDPQQQIEEGAEADPAGAAEEAEDGIRTISIVGRDDMSYDVTEINMEPGETIRIELVTESNMPPAAMSHNIAITEPGIDMSGFINESRRAEDNEYIAPGFEDQVIVATAMLGDGESDVIEFTAPEEPGEFPFVCTFPGHYEAGMTGTIYVE